MPEMPEVEALARFLDTRTKRRRIESARPYTAHALKTFDPPVEALLGRTIETVARQGKFLVLRTAVDDDAPLHLVVHFSLAGWLRWSEALPTAPIKPGGAISLRVRLDDGSGFDVTEAGTKHGLALHVVRDPAEVPGVARLGPDALELDLASFSALLATRSTRIKNVLKDQAVVAGIGNAYSDEILHVARMSPYALANRLSAEETGMLYAAMRETLLAAIGSASGRPPAELKDAKRAAMRVHGRDGQACPACGDRVRSVKFADSSFQYCPTCQTGGKPLADRVLSRLVK